MENSGMHRFREASFLQNFSASYSTFSVFISFLSVMNLSEMRQNVALKFILTAIFLQHEFHTIIEVLIPGKGFCTIISLLLCVSSLVGSIMITDGTGSLFP